MNKLRVLLPALALTALGAGGWLASRRAPPPPQPEAPFFSPARSLGLQIRAARSQATTTQLDDEARCYVSSRQSAGAGRAAGFKRRFAACMIERGYSVLKAPDVTRL